MTIAQKTRLKVKNLKPKIGAEIHADKDVLLSGGHAAEIRELLEQRGVLVFPKMSFTDEEQIAFTKTLGTFAKETTGQDIYKITMDAKETPNAEYLKGAFFWHIDGTMSPMPILASILSSKVLPRTGGNTEFSSTYAAYEDLPEEEKKALEGLRVVHAMAASQLYFNPEPSLAKWQEWMKLGTKELPLVWTHRSGRKSLVIGNTADHIVGMDSMKSRELLIRLRDWATQPQFVYSHHWSLGDTVMWDNTGTMHRATEYPLDSGRMMHRTKLEGEEPIAA